MNFGNVYTSKKTLTYSAILFCVAIGHLLVYVLFNASSLQAHTDRGFTGPGGTDSNSIQAGARSNGTVGRGGNRRQSFTNPDGSVATRRIDSGGSGGGGGTQPPPPPPPTVTLVAELNNDTHSENISVLPVDTVDIQWNSPNATTCEGQLALSGMVTGTSGQYTVDLNDFTAGEVREYHVRCRRSSGGQNSSWRTETLSVTLLGLNMNFDLDRSIIRVGDSVTVSWDVAIDGNATAHEGVTIHPDLACDLAGAIREDINIQEAPSGSMESGPVFNFFENRLRCSYPETEHSYSVTRSLEVVPAAQER